MNGDQLSLLGGILILADLAIRITALIIVPRDRKPTAAMAWLLAIFLIPFIGIILFLVIGNPRLPKKRRDKQDELNRIITDRAQGYYDRSPGSADPTGQLAASLGSVIAIAAFVFWIWLSIDLLRIGKRGRRNAIDVLIHRIRLPRSR